MTSKPQSARTLTADVRSGVIGWLVTLIGTATGAGIAKLALGIGWPATALLFLILIVVAMVARIMVLIEMWRVKDRDENSAERLARSVDINELTKYVRSLGDKVATVDWTYDAEEHRREVYRKITELVSDSRVRGYWVVTNFRPLAMGIDEKSLESIDAYYRTIEDALEDRAGFDYRRVAILRGEVSAPEPARTDEGDEAALRRFVESRYRKGFFKHYARLRQHQVTLNTGSNWGIRMSQAGGRILDLSFALTFNEQREALALVIELGVARPPGGGHGPETERDALALLTVQHPSAPLRDAFAQAFQALYDREDVAKKIDAKTVEQMILPAAYP